MGPIFSDTLITAEVYHNIIQQFITFSHKDERDIVFQQDNAWLLVAKDMTSFLAELFGEQICKWPSHSPDLRPSDFFQTVIIYKAGYTLIAKYAKMDAECEKWKVYSGVFRITFFAFHAPFFAFRISQHFALGLAFARKLKGFRGLFFRGINKTWNSPEMRKVYRQCFVFRGVFREIPAKCEIRKVYNRSKDAPWSFAELKKKIEHLIFYKCISNFPESYSKITNNFF